MKTDRIRDAINEAEKFISHAHLLIGVRGKNQDTAEYNHPIEQGFVKRSSLDLTRVLAAMRRAS